MPRGFARRGGHGRFWNWLVHNYEECLHLSKWVTHLHFASAHKNSFPRYAYPRVKKGPEKRGKGVFIKSYRCQFLPRTNYVEKFSILAQLKSSLKKCNCHVNHSSSQPASTIIIRFRKQYVHDKVTKFFFTRCGIAAIKLFASGTLLRNHSFQQLIENLMQQRRELKDFVVVWALNLIDKIKRSHREMQHNA